MMFVRHYSVVAEKPVSDEIIEYCYRDVTIYIYFNEILFFFFVEI